MDDIKFRTVASGKFDKNRLIDDKSKTDLELAEMNYKFIEETEIDNNLLSKECLVLKSSIEIFSLLNDEVCNFEDLNDNEFILYTINHVIYKPVCFKINTIMIPSSTDKCYEHLPIRFRYISFKLKTKLLNGFLTTNGIIRLLSKEVSCDYSSQYYTLKNS